MKQNNEIILKSSDESAKFVTGISGWVDRFGRFFGNGKESEDMARFSGCTHDACGECGKPTPKNWLRCDKCRLKKEIEKYNAMPTRPYDGSVVYSEADDKYFFDSDELADYCDEEELYPRYLRLIFCEPNYAKEIDAYDHFCDDLCEDAEVPSVLQAAFDELNKAIREHKEPLSWSPGKIAVEWVE